MVTRDGLGIDQPSASHHSTIALTGRLNNLIAEIYQVSTQAHRLQHVLDEMTWLCGADNGGLSVVDMATGEALGFLISPTGVWTDAELLGMFHALEPWRRATLQHEPGRVLIDSESRALSEVTSSPQYTRWLQTTGNRSRCFAHLRPRAEITVFLGFARGSNRPAFSRNCVKELEALLPHLLNAMRLNQTINELTVMHDVAEERYGTLGVGVFLLTAEAHVLYASRAARRILELGLGLSVEDRRLRCAVSRDQEALYKLIESQARIAGRPGYIAGESMALQRPQGQDASLSLMIAPYHNRLQVRSVTASVGQVLMLVFDPSYRAPTREQALQHLYGLSPAEAELAGALAAGKRLEQIARESGVSKETLRSRLRRIFLKTGTRRQAELLTVLLSGPAHLEHRTSVKMT